MSSIKDALEYALNAFEHLHNTQTYQGDNQDYSDEIITMRAALAELEQAQQEQAQSGWLRAIDEALVVHDVGVANANDAYEQAKEKLNKLLCVVQDIGSYFAKEPAQAVEPIGYYKGVPMYLHPPKPTIDSDTRKQLLNEFPLLDDKDLSETEHPAEWAIQQDRKRLHKILKRLEAGE